MAHRGDGASTEQLSRRVEFQQPDCRVATWRRQSRCSTRGITTRTRGSRGVRRWLPKQSISAAYRKASRSKLLYINQLSAELRSQALRDGTSKVAGSTTKVRNVSTRGSQKNSFISNTTFEGTRLSLAS